MDLNKPLYVVGSIKAGGYIKAGEAYGIIAGLSITAKTTISFGLKIFAGICAFKEINDLDKTITCSAIEGGGVVEYGILNIVKENEIKQPKIIVVDGVKYQKIKE